MRSLRIAMVAPCPFPTPQGTQVFIGQLARALGECGHRVDLITYHYGDENIREIVPPHRSRPLPISGRLTSGPSLRKPLFDLLLTVKLDQVVRRKGADLIHAHNYEGALAGLLVSRLRKVPLVFHTHNIMTDELPGYFRSAIGRNLARHLGSFLDRQVPRRADACIAVTPQTARFIRRMGVIPGRATIIPPAIDADQFAGPSAREQSDGARLLYAGNLDHYQNLGFLLESFARVLAHRPDCRLWIVTHARPELLEKTARRLDTEKAVTVIRADSFETLRCYLERCDLALCPRISPYGFPIKLLNYLAAGKPVVACRSSAQGVHHGVDGWVVEDNDVAGFAGAVLTLLQDEELRRRLSANARRTALERFSWKTLIPRYEEVYAETLKRWQAQHRRKGNISDRMGTGGLSGWSSF
jgi:1,2-diacylglycerol 3-alpha-glucosyltransferase